MVCIKRSVKWVLSTGKLLQGGLPSRYCEVTDWLNMTLLLTELTASFFRLGNTQHVLGHSLGNQLNKEILGALSFYKEEKVLHG